jgi:O-antigen/teichoic acid export membrane protein
MTAERIPARRATRRTSLRLAGLFQTYSWGLGDQAVIAASNFITAVLLARGLGPSGFGSFTLVYGILLFANSLFGALVARPHNVLGATRQGEDYVRYTTSTAAGAVGFVWLATLFAVAGGTVAYLADWSAAPLLFALAPAIAAWQLQEFVRRVLYTEGRLSAALLNDIVSYAGQGAAVAALWRLNALTGPVALLVLAATSALGVALGAWQLQGSLTRHFDPTVLKENWRFGKWLAGAETLYFFTSPSMYMYLAAMILNTAATGVLRASEVVFGPMRVLMYFLDTVLPTRFSRILDAGGDAGLNAELKNTYLVTIPIMAIYCSLVAIFAHSLLRAMYGKYYAGGTIVLQIWAAFAFVSLLAHVVTSALSAKHLTRSIFTSYIYASLVSVSLSWLLIKALGINGVVVSVLLNALVAHLLFLTAYRRDKFQEPSRSVVVLSTRP